MELNGLSLQPYTFNLFPGHGIIVPIVVSGRGRSDQDRNFPSGGPLKRGILGGRLVSCHVSNDVRLRWILVRLQGASTGTYRE